MKILSYIVLALFLAVASLAATYYTKSKVQDEKIAMLEADLDVAKDSLDTVRTAVDASDKVLRALSGALNSIEQRGSEISERVTTLEKNHEEIRVLLATPLPSGGCLLDDSCTAAVVRPAERRTPGPVYPAENP
jgi:cob(I)alamin adenosyltransferase